MERNHVTDDDEGKAVVDSSGQKIGMVSEVKSGTAYVDADPSLTDSIRSKLGWGDADDDYTLAKAVSTPSLTTKSDSSTAHRRRLVRADGTFIRTVDEPGSGLTEPGPGVGRDVPILC